MSTSGANPGARGIYGTSAFSPRYFHSHTIAYDVVSSEMRALTLSASDISITSEYSLKVPMDRVERNRLAGRRPEHIWHVFGAPSNYIFISHNSAARLLPIVERAERLGRTLGNDALMLVDTSEQIQAVFQERWIAATELPKDVDLYAGPRPNDMLWPRASLRSTCRCSSPLTRTSLRWRRFSTD